MRNKSKQGIGFFDVHGFYPDFIMWLIAGSKQYITFIDPKGIRHLRSFNDPKIKLAKIIRTEIEPRLCDSDVVLNSFIISNTPITAVSHWIANKDKTVLDAQDFKTFNENHIYFQYQQSEVYIRDIFESLIGLCTHRQQ